MAQFVGYGKSRAQPVVFADGTASDRVTKRSQFGQACRKERNKDLLAKAVLAQNASMQRRVTATEDTHGRLT